MSELEGTRIPYKVLYDDFAARGVEDSLTLIRSKAEAQSVIDTGVLDELTDDQKAELLNKNYELYNVVILSIGPISSTEHSYRGELVEMIAGEATLGFVFLSDRVTPTTWSADSKVSSTVVLIEKDAFDFSGAGSCYGVGWTEYRYNTNYPEKGVTTVPHPPKV